MLRIISANLNGIRSANTKGFFDWMKTTGADVVCVQELKAQAADLSGGMRNPDGYQGFFHYAEKKGYSGVGLYCRRAPDRVIEAMGHAEFDAEGRVIRADFGKLSVFSVYVPSGSSSPERQAAKFRFLDVFLPFMTALHAEGRECIVCGDWNIAHQEIDLKNWKGNLKNSGFLPEERAWLDRLYAGGWTDVYRRLYPDATEMAYQAVEIFPHAFGYRPLMATNSIWRTPDGTWEPGFSRFLAPFRVTDRLSAICGRISPYTVFNRQPKIVAIRVRL